MKVSDHPTYLAEAIVEAGVNQAWLQVSAKLVSPLMLKTVKAAVLRLSVMAKSAVWELISNSDLDIVFMHVIARYTSILDGKKEI
ncbi:hypothetical protein OK016_11660 [Vibrio chagasii]|nr:hypothetical protein [Vibrio chagasii]